MKREFDLEAPANRPALVKLDLPVEENLFNRFNRFASIEGCPADDQLEEQHKQRKHEHQGNDDPAKVQ